MSRGAVAQITSKFNGTNACQVHKSRVNLAMLWVRRSKAESVKVNLVQQNVHFQAGGKYWKNADWYLGKHLAGMGVKVGIHKSRQINSKSIFKFR